MSGLLSRRHGGEAAAGLLLAMTILVFAPTSFGLNGLLEGARPSTKNDFTSYYVAGLAVRQGMPEALYYPQPVGSLLAQASQQHPWIDLARPAGIDNPNYYLYPPLFAVLFAPLTLLPYKIAYLFWAGLSAACLAVSLAMLWGARRPDGVPARAGSERLMTASAIVLAACLFYPVSRNFAVGQSSLLLLALMAAALTMLRRTTRSGDAWGGLCLAGGIVLKLTPAIFLLWLLIRRRWRALACTCAALAGLLLVSILWVGVVPHQVYFGQMVARLSGGTAFYPNQSLSGLLARAWGGDWHLADLVEPGSAPARLASLIGLMLIGASLLVIWKRRLDDDHAFALLVPAMLAASPISWEHHYVLALIPAWVLMRDAADSRLLSGARSVIAGGALALIGSYIGLRVIDAPGGGIVSQLTASACLLGGLTIWVLMASGENRAASRRIDPADSHGVGRSLLVLVSVFAAGVFFFKLIEYNRAYRYGDFTSYYVAAATLVDGDGPLYYPDTPDMILARAVTPSRWTETALKWGVPEANYYLYPPFFALALVPLALIPYGTAHTVWYIANLAALGGCVWLLLAPRREEDAGEPHRSGPHERALVVISIALSWPALFTFGAGQANFVVLLLLLGALWCLRSGRDIPAGLMTAGAAAIKMTPVLLLVFLAWRRRWVALGAAATGLAALVAAGAAAAGWSSYVVYMERMVPLLSRGCAHWVNQSLAAFFTRLVDGGDMFSWALGHPSSMTRALTMLASLLVIGCSFLVVGRRQTCLDLEFALLVETTLFVSPLSWTHHSVLSLMSFLLVARHLARRGEMTIRMAGLLAISFTLVHVYGRPPGLLERGALNVLASYNLLGNLLLWGIIAWLLRREQAPAAEASVRVAG